MNIFKKIAKTYGVSKNDVLRDIQKAIDEAWATEDVDTKKYQNQLFPDGKPTPEELINILAQLSSMY